MQRYRRVWLGLAVLALASGATVSGEEVPTERLEQDAAASVSVAMPPDGEADDDAAEVKQLEEACATETFGSCAELATRFAEGRGVPKDAARRWLLRQSLHRRRCG